MCNIEIETKVSGSNNNMFDVKKLALYVHGEASSMHKTDANIIDICIIYVTYIFNYSILNLLIGIENITSDHNSITYCMPGSW